MLHHTQSRYCTTSFPDSTPISVVGILVEQHFSLVLMAILRSDYRSGSVSSLMDVVRIIQTLTRRCGGPAGSRAVSSFLKVH